MSLSVCNTVTDENGLEITEHGTALFPVACYDTHLSEKQVPWHWHEDFEAILVTEGTALVLIGTEKIRLVSGKGILLNTGILHSVVPADGNTCILKSICWHPRLTGGRDDSVYWQKYTSVFLSERSFGFLLFEVFEEMEKEAILYFSDAWEKCAQETDGYEMDIRNDLSKILYYAYRQQEREGHRRTEKEIRMEKRLKQMMGLIREHYAEQITIADIADAALVSVSECLRCFNRILGITPVRYLRKVRLEKAAALLHMGGSVSESAALCGFDDMSYFAREFKKEYGCKPSEYKKNSRGIS